MSEDNGYKAKRKQVLLAHAGQGTYHAITGQTGFTPLEPAGADVAGIETPWKVADFDPRVKWVSGRASYDWWLKDDSIIELKAQAEAAHVPVTYYHFLMPNRTQVQIDLYLHQLQKVGGPWGIRAICDVEYQPAKKPRTKNEKILAKWAHDNPSLKVWAEQVRQFVDAIDQATGQLTDMYGSAVTLGLLGDQPWLWGRRVWLAWYPYWWLINTFNNTPPASLIPKWASTWIAWQYFDKGRSNGLEPNDLNVMNPEYLQGLGVQP